MALWDHGKKKGKVFHYHGVLLPRRSSARLLILSGLYQLKRERLLESLGTILSAGETGATARVQPAVQQRSGEEMRVNWHVAASGQRKSTEKEGVDADCYVDVILI